MATPKKQWPKVANEARLTTIDNLADIQNILKQAKQELRKRNSDLVLSLIAQAELLAKLGQNELENVPKGEDLDNGD